MTSIQHAVLIKCWKNTPRLWAVAHAHMRFLCLISYVWASKNKNVGLASDITDWCIEKIRRDINQLITHKESEKKEKHKRNSKHDDKKSDLATRKEQTILKVNYGKFYSLNHFFRILNNQSTNLRYTWNTSASSSLRKWSRWWWWQNNKLLVLFFGKWH